MSSVNDVSGFSVSRGETRGEQVVDEEAEGAVEDSADLTTVVFGEGRETRESVVEGGSRGRDEERGFLVRGL